MADAAATRGRAGPLLWLGAVAVGAIVPAGRRLPRKANGQLEALAPGHRRRLVGAVCMRVAFYNLGLSVFMFY